MTEPIRLRELLERLVSAEVRFVLIGGLAVNAWGYVRGTKDVDIVPDPDTANLDRLADLLVSLGGRVEAGQGMLAPNAIGTFLRAGDRTLVSTELGFVDVLQGIRRSRPTPGWLPMLRRSTWGPSACESARSRLFST